MGMSTAHRAFNVPLSLGHQVRVTDDFLRGVDFARWVFLRCVDELDLPRIVLWTDSHVTASRVTSGMKKAHMCEFGLTATHVVPERRSPCTLQYRSSSPTLTDVHCVYGVARDNVRVNVCVKECIQTDAILVTSKDRWLCKTAVYLKTRVYETPLPRNMNSETLTSNVSVTVRSRPHIFERVRHPVVHRCNMCIIMGGRHFQQLL
ncbi:unnamed protein product [Timema podura]|uniref:Uncharacterized protein n=1 Tax=Timema podura TaxID=61482 RepID=A0ABN7NZQ5_TIMPD|nr:unnamed protein product [Timema podura]